MNENDIMNTAIISIRFTNDPDIDPFGCVAAGCIVSQLVDLGFDAILEDVKTKQKNHNTTTGEHK